MSVNKAFTCTFDYYCCHCKPVFYSYTNVHSKNKYIYEENAGTCFKLNFCAFAALYQLCFYYSE